MTDKTTAGMGHNNPPPYSQESRDAAQAAVDKFNETAKAWLNIEGVEDADRAEKLNDFLTGGKKLSTRIESTRKTQKQPHLDAGTEVDKVFNSMKATLAKMDERLRPFLDAFLRKEKEKAEAERREKEAAARLKEEEAKAAAAKVAEAENDIAAQQAAEDAAAEAEKAAKAAAKPAKASVGSATGGGKTTSLRTTRKAKVTNISKLFMYYREAPEVEEVLLRLANADIRAKDVDESKILGIEIVETENSV